MTHSLLIVYLNVGPHVEVLEGDLQVQVDGGPFLLLLLLPPEAPAEEGYLERRVLCRFQIILLRREIISRKGGTFFSSRTIENAAGTGARARILVQALLAVGIILLPFFRVGKHLVGCGMRGRKIKLLFLKVD